MSREKKILICLDADHEIGLGHAVRTSAVLAALGRPVRVAVAGEGAQLKTFFPGAQRFAANDAAGAVTAFAPDLVLADPARADAAWWSALDAAAGTIPMAAIDDFGGDVIADLVINGTVLEQYHRYPCLRAGARVLAGAGYALLRAEFGEQRWREPAAPQVTIVVGSGDAARDWALWLVSGQLAMEGWGRVRMIVGAAFPDKPLLERACRERGVVLEHGLTATQMAQALAGSTLALTTGGMVVYEAVAVGVPLVVFPQMANMIPEIAWLARAGCVTDLGADGGHDATRVGNALAHLLASRDERSAMSAAQRAVTDGRGVHTAAQAINALLDREAA
jgi:spore coat polysaccharide biosynthesis predicted glycosyltransferase SpsG